MSALSRDELLDIFKSSQAYLEGHFLLSSGLHSPNYLQCARVLMNPGTAELLGRALADEVEAHRIQAVVSPALGGVIIGHEVARALGVRAIFTERVGGSMVLRRGFGVAPGERILVVEDVLTTGGSTREVMESVRSLGGVPVAAAAIVFRGSDPKSLGLPFHSLLELAIPAWPPEKCPLCAAGDTPAVKPGSRGLS